MHNAYIKSANPVLSRRHQELQWHLYVWGTHTLNSHSCQDSYAWESPVLGEEDIFLACTEEEKGQECWMSVKRKFRRNVQETLHWLAKYTEFQPVLSKGENLASPCAVFFPYTHTHIFLYHHIVISQKSINGQHSISAPNPIGPSCLQFWGTWGTQGWWSYCSGVCILGNQNLAK